MLHIATLPTLDPHTALIANLRALVPEISARAAELDRTGAFPVEDVADLHDIGLLTAALPMRMGGFGLGCEPEGRDMLLLILRLIGGASLSLGRLYEGHVNAIALLAAHGAADQLAAVAEDAASGRLFGVWNTDGDVPVTLARRDGAWLLEGAKRLASGAGHVERALVTATLEDGGRQMVLARLASGERADLSEWRAQGMRSSASGSVDFTGLPLGEDALIGHPGDYLRQPAFSGGAWRFLAVQLGGMEALLEQLRVHLIESDRAEAPQQQARFGQAAIAVETAQLWVMAAAEQAESRFDDSERIVAHVGLARLAVERAALDLLERVQRSVGLAAFMAPHPIERIARDLATYLRQPAPDLALAEAAAHLLQTGPLAER